jgi:hypothetical protein
MRTLHGLHFVGTAKDDKDAAVNGLRVALGQGKIVISADAVSICLEDDGEPKITRGGAPRLVGQLRRCRYNRARTGWERSDLDGHYDLVDALVYMVRNVDWSRNPYPAHDGRVTSNTYHVVRTPRNNDLSQIMGMAAKLGKRR